MAEFEIKKVDNSYAQRIQSLLASKNITRKIRYLLQEKCLIAIDNNDTVIAFAENIPTGKNPIHTEIVYFTKDGKKKKSRIKVALLEAITSKKFWPKKIPAEKLDPPRLKQSTYMFPG